VGETGGRGLGGLLINKVALNKKTEKYFAPPIYGGAKPLNKYGRHY
jgi:hypothetical protein